MKILCLLIQQNIASFTNHQSHNCLFVVKPLYEPNASWLLMEPSELYFSVIRIKIQLSYQKMNLKKSSEKRQPFCLSLNVYMSHWCAFLLVQIMACHLFDDRPLSEPMMTSHQSHLKEKISMKKLSKLIYFHNFNSLRPSEAYMRQ